MRALLLGGRKYGGSISLDDFVKCVSAFQIKFSNGSRPDLSAYSLVQNYLGKKKSAYSIFERVTGYSPSFEGISS